MFSLFPPHAGMRQYWRDFDSLERWARSMPHQAWWRQFLRNSGGTGFWHEACFMRGGMEVVYDDMVKATGFLAFAPARPARGAMFSARGRALRPGSSSIAAPVDEGTLYPMHEDRERSITADILAQLPDRHSHRVVPLSALMKNPASPIRDARFAPSPNTAVAW
jgi:hypothetical protein